MQVHYIANELVARGHFVRVYSYFPPTADARYDVKQSAVPALVRWAISRLNGLSMWFFPILVAREDFSSFDLIHAHGDSHFIVNRIPKVRTFHGSALDEALHATSVRRFVAMIALYPLELASGLLAHACVFDSSSAARRFPFAGKRLIPECVDLDVFFPRGEKSARPSILFVAGSIGGRKRGRDLVRTFHTVVRPRLPNAELWLVCRERIDEPGIRWLGPIPKDELVAAYSAAWVFCLPSSYEGFGVPYIEAMACGTPVVATPNDGAREILENGKYGVIVDLEQLGEGLVELLKDERKRAELREKGLAYVQRFSLKHVVDEYEQLYRELLRKQRHQR